MMPHNPFYRACDAMTWEGRSIIRILALVFVVFCALNIPYASPAQSSEKTNSPPLYRKQGTVDFTADSMTIDRDKHRIELTGKVRAVRNDMTLASDRLVIEYEGSINNATSLNATGNVVIHIQDRTVIYSRWARMETDTGTVTLGDDVEFRQDGTLLKGKKLIIDLKTGLSKMTGGRVSGQFIPD